MVALPSAVRYWWVNQNQTFRQEQAGGYLWSPRRNANGARNRFYKTVREVSSGDVVKRLNALVLQKVAKV